MPYIINDSYSAKSVNNRIRFLVLHFTAGNFLSSLNELTQGQVSSHYLVPEEPISGKSEIYQLVPENLRAWHAGLSAWQDRTNLNDTSIGIEIVNRGYTEQKGKKTWFPFSDYQIEMVIELVKDLINRYQIEPTCIVGHGDIAPGRKVDPGPLFPWKKLYDCGIGAWYEEPDKKHAESLIKNKQVAINWIQKNLRTYGYSIEETGKLDNRTKAVITAFQMHFRPGNYDGIPDRETCAILDALVKKYYPQAALPLTESHLFESQNEANSLLTIYAKTHKNLVDDSPINTEEKAQQTLKKIDLACTEALNGDLTSIEKKIITTIQSKLFSNSLMDPVKTVRNLAADIESAERKIGKGSNSFLRFVKACKAAIEAFFTPKQSVVEAFKKTYRSNIFDTLKQEMESMDFNDFDNQPKLC